jgi:hypothetical protein
MFKKVHKFLIIDEIYYSLLQLATLKGRAQFTGMLVNDILLDYIEKNKHLMDGNETKPVLLRQSYERLQRSIELHGYKKGEI